MPQVNRVFANLLFCLMLQMSQTSFAQTTDSLKKWNLGFQMTSIYQQHPSFDAKYSGDNSLQTAEEGALSLTSTLFLDVPLWKGATFSFNPEMSGGKGLSQAHGLAGFSNGETFRIGNAEPVVYVARAFVEQKFKFKNEQTLQIVAGKFGLADYFDDNPYAHDPRTQFLNWALMAHGAWDYAANTRGYTVGLYANYEYKTWQFRAVFAALPKAANGPILNYNFDKTNAINIEIEKEIKHPNNSVTNIKLLAYRNLAGMGNYHQANQHLNLPFTPAVTETRQDGRTKYGIGLNISYNHADKWGLFGRASYNDGLNETWAFTEIDHSISIGASLQGKLWHRNKDFAGFALVANGLSAEHQLYQKLGGDGFIIGDGGLNYGLETIAEVFYSFAVPNTNFTLSPDYQFVINPAYNKDRGTVHIFALRFHTAF
jgi:high affinity Mn2+ porin